MLHLRPRIFTRMRPRILSLRPRIYTRLRPRIFSHLRPRILLAYDPAFYNEIMNSTNELVKIWSLRKPKILYETSFRVKLCFTEKFDIFLFIH